MNDTVIQGSNQIVSGCISDTELMKILSLGYRCVDLLVGIVDGGNCEVVEGLDCEDLILDSRAFLELVEIALAKCQKI